MICSLSASVPFSFVISLAVSDNVSEATSFTALSRDLLWDEYGVARGGSGIFMMAQKQHACNQAQLIIFISILTNERSVEKHPILSEVINLLSQLQDVLKIIKYEAKPFLFFGSSCISKFNS